MKSLDRIKDTRDIIRSSTKNITITGTYFFILRYNECEYLNLSLRLLLRLYHSNKLLGSEKLRLFPLVARFWNYPKIIICC